MFESFSIGPLTIWLRLIFLLIGILLGTEFFLRLAASAGLSVQIVKDHARWHLIAFLVCGRLLAVVGDYQTYIRHLSRILIVWDGAFSFLGGALGIALVLFFSTRTLRTTFLQWLDVLLPSVTFGFAFDWFGMFLGAQAYGKPTNVPWGVTLNGIDVRFSVPIHPVQLYYAFFYLTLTFCLLLIRRHSKRAGAETLLGIVAASFAVFFFEFFRGDFGISVFPLMTDFIFIGLLILSLGVLALLEQRLSERGNVVYGAVVAAVTVAYVLYRPWITLPQYPLRFSQVLSVLALLATVVYVVVHRRKYPHL